MEPTAERYRKIAAAFTERVRNVPGGAWGCPRRRPPPGPTPLPAKVGFEWMPALSLASIGAPLPAIPAVDDNPTAAWDALDRALQAALDDPAIAQTEFDSRGGRHTVEAAIGMFGVPDILIHTWDLARATGQDETLDPGEVHALFHAMEPIDAALRQSGHYGPRVELPAEFRFRAVDQAGFAVAFGLEPVVGRAEGLVVGTFRNSSAHRSPIALHANSTRARAPVRRIQQ